MIINMKCPSCGATMQFDDTKSVMDCPYCGGQVANIAEQLNITQNVNVSGTVVHVQDRSNDPNLFITYNTNNPSVLMVSRIVDTGVKGSYVNGQTQSYHLSQGPHTVVLKIGKKNYSREIVIPSDNQPVRIYASFTGRAQISVDQPNIPVPQASSSSGDSVSAQTATAYVQPAPKDPGKPKSPMSILAFILSLTFYLSWAGAALGAVEIFVLDKKKDKNQIFSYIAMGIGTIMTLCLILGACGPKRNTTDITAAPTIEITTAVTTEATTKETTAVTTTTAATTAAGETDTDTTEADTGSDSGLVDPALKEYLDSYEAFMDEYIDFMKKMNDDPNDLTVLAEYADMMVKYSEFAEAIDKYDPDTMSPADSAYYDLVISRVSAKMLEANLEIAST